MLWRILANSERHSRSPHHNRLWEHESEPGFHHAVRRLERAQSAAKGRVRLFRSVVCCLRFRDFRRFEAECFWLYPE